MTVRFCYDLRSHWIGTVRDLKGKRTVCKAKAKRKGAHGSLSGSSRVDGGGRVIDIGTRNRTIVVFDNEATEASRPISAIAATINRMTVLRRSILDESVNALRLTAD